MIGEGPSARSVKLDLPPFTLIGATTRAGMLTNPLRDRFGIVARLEFYTPEELALIVARSAHLLSVEIAEEGAVEIARVRAARRASPTACCAGCAISPRSRLTARSIAPVADAALNMLDVDQPRSRRDGPQAAVSAMLEKFGGGPVGVDNLAAAIGEAARHHRGRAGTVSDPARLPAAHPARPCGDNRWPGGISD